MKQNKTKALTIIAKIISRVFGFGTVVILGVVAFYSGKFTNTNFIWILFPLGVAIIAGVLLYILVKLKLFTDFDLTDRKERPPFLFLLIVLGLFVLFVYVVYDVDKILQFVIVVYLVEMIINFMVTLFWKISNHALAITSFVLFSVSLLGHDYWFLMILIPLVGWSRVYLKKHTVAQFIAGTMVPFVVIVPLARLFGLL